MFGIDAPEFLVIAIVAIMVIGPKDMPRALRTLGRWVGKVRKVSGHFRAGFDAMVREAELEEMEQKWKAQNEKIMRDHPEGAPAQMEPTGAYPSAHPPARAAAMKEMDARDEAAIIAKKQAAAQASAAPSAVPGVSAESALAASPADQASPPAGRIEP